MISSFLHSKRSAAFTPILFGLLLVCYMLPGALIVAGCAPTYDPDYIPPPSNPLGPDQDVNNAIAPPPPIAEPHEQMHCSP